MLFLNFWLKLPLEMALNELNRFQVLTACEISGLDWTKLKFETIAIANEMDI